MSLDLAADAAFPTPAYDIPGALRALLRARADEGRARLADATPVDTGWARHGWEVLHLGPEGFAVVNSVVNPRTGYSYPQGLITGTGARGVRTTGYTGGHRADWPGTRPSATLHPAWEGEVTIGFSLPAGLFGGAP